MRWKGHVAGMEEVINAYKIPFGKPEGKRLLQDLGVDGKIILKRHSNKDDSICGPVINPCEQDK
jgi:hypothetical protein